MKKIIILLSVALACFAASSPMYASNWTDYRDATVNSMRNSLRQGNNSPITKEDMHVGKATPSLFNLGQNVEEKLNLKQKAEEVTLKDSFLAVIQKYLLRLVWLVAIAVFIYAGFNLFMAKGDDKEYGKAWKALTYAAVGLAIIPLSYVLVKIVLGFNI